MRAFTKNLGKSSFALLQDPILEHGGQERDGQAQVEQQLVEDGLRGVRLGPARVVDLVADVGVGVDRDGVEAEPVHVGLDRLRFEQMHIFFSKI